MGFTQDNKAVIIGAVITGIFGLTGALITAGYIKFPFHHETIILKQTDPGVNRDYLKRQAKLDSLKQVYAGLKAAEIKRKYEMDSIKNLDVIAENIYDESSEQDRHAGNY